MLGIGEFSKICGVSIQTLRYYDQIELFSPYYVNPENGYRYYNTSQIPILLLISRLKRYEFSLPQIQSILKNNNAQEQLNLLQKQKDILLQQIDKKQITLKEIEKQIKNMQQGENIMSYPEKYKIEVLERKEEPIISCRQMMGIDEFGKYFGILFENLEKEKATPASKPMAIYHDKEFNPDCSDIELAIAIVEKEKATRILEGGLFAHTIHYGSYKNLPDAYGTLTQWIEDSDYKSAGAPFEIYEESNIAGLPIEKWKTDIYFPIIKK